MDIYDETRKRIEKFDQKKLMIYTSIIAFILIIVIIGFLIYANKAALGNKHLFDPSGNSTSKREEEERKRQEKILEDPELKEVYDKIFKNQDLSF